ncbi:MAG: FtsX-like permease family protein [Candidatus Aminicenantes bacterium]|nr:MAG: FtsX-like permease family protein [Candidatus Aminicenantes bacterium]RPJ03428.1 MAG: FtsX-like permease family protein [Candidatus Aminicenantes bacterium]
MKSFRLVWANLRRKKVRTTLTIGSFAVALFLFGLLAAIRVGFRGGADAAGADRLNVINRVSLILPLPLSYRDRVLQVPGVANVTYATWFGGVYQDERNFFAQFAVDKDTWFDVYADYVVSPEGRAAFMRDRQACMVGRALAKRFGFKVGDRIPVRGTIWAGDWEFNIAGIFEGSRPDADTTGMFFRADYLEENRQFGKGTVGWYVVKLRDPGDAVQVTKAIDALFANSPFETLTQTEKAFAASFVNQMGNIELLIMTIGLVVFFTLLLVTGNTMAIAVRERSGELAVLKTIGFSDPRVMRLILAEAVLIAAQGGLVGLALAKLVLPGLTRALPMLGVLYVSPLTFAAGFLLALAVGAAAGLLPAIGAMRLKVVDALRRV